MEFASIGIALPFCLAAMVMPNLLRKKSDTDLMYSPSSLLNENETCPASFPYCTVSLREVQPDYSHEFLIHGDTSWNDILIVCLTKCSEALSRSESPFCPICPLSPAIFDRLYRFRLFPIGGIAEDWHDQVLAYYPLGLLWSIALVIPVPSPGQELDRAGERSGTFVYQG